MVPERLQRHLNTGEPDDASVAYRVATAGCVVVSVLAAVLQDAVSRSIGVSAVLLVPLGFVFSYIRRGQRNTWLKILLTIGLFAAFAGFLSAIRGAASVDDTRTPLVGVFLWVQVLHSFDVPRARDLTFSVAASVVLIALAGSLAFSTSFIVFVLIHAFLLVAALVLAYRAELRRPDASLGVPSTRTTDVGARQSWNAQVVRRGAALTVATLLLTSVVFVFLPRLPAQQISALPFSLGKANPVEGFTGQVSSPGDSAGSDVGSSEAFDPDNYFGYGAQLNLRARGQLSDELVLRVRSPRPTLYRAQGFDRYEDGRWTSSDQELDEVFGAAGFDSINMPRPIEQVDDGDSLIQTFYVERELPNIVFHAYRAKELFVAETRVFVDDEGSIRTGFEMDEDTIYSVESAIPDRNIEQLRSAVPADVNDPALARYLELPETLRGRFSELAQQITADRAPADKAEAVQAWLKENKRYRLDISRDPPNRDPVDVFTFERDEGFCEQIAATMALMLRASGVPTRIVTGFGEGERNLFTGYWEVRNSDAHAWVEVLYPGLGWVPYDPTFGVPLATAANTTFMLAPLQRVTGAVPGLLSDAGRAFVRAIRALPGPDWTGTSAVLLAVGGLVVLVLRFRTARRAAARARRGRIVSAWLDLESALAARGWRRDDAETPSEFAHRVAPAVPADVIALASRFGALRYGPHDGDVGAWERDVAAAAATIRRSKVNA